MARAWYVIVGSSVPAEPIVAHLMSCGLSLVSLGDASPEGHGILLFHEFSSSLCAAVRSLSKGGHVRVIAASTAMDAPEKNQIWNLIDAGAADVVPLSQAGAAEKIAKQLIRWDAVDGLLNSPELQGRLAGSSPTWRSILRQIVDVAHYSRSSVLVGGESGTGKELVARLIHRLDSRQDKGTFVVLDCTTVVPELSGSEFFGHERGAFTGAVSPRDGAFALANKGTLFLDEVGELPLPLQAQLLRVVQERTYKRVGGNAWFETDFRLICATNRDLKRAVAEGAFRSDLYYRITEWTCILPPLRNRIEDVLPLTRHFIRRFKPDGELPEIDTTVRDFLLAREYPGNVRDLQQLIARIMHRYAGSGPITVGDIPDEERRNAEESAPADWNNGDFETAVRRALLFNAGLKDIRRAVENIAINLAVEEEQGNLQRAARKLGVTDRALQLRRAAARQQKSLDA